jgi:hypothetical protein
MKTLTGALAILCALSSTDAIAQRQLRHQSARFTKQAECLKQAKMKRFERRPVMNRLERPTDARKRFMRQCMGRS